jgi:SAM-dependent methyltransferase
MSNTTGRPFYTDYAWAFDLLIDRPVAKECRAIVGWLIERGVVPGAPLLDAGCGTGRYAVELARRGYIVEGIDRSPELIAVAAQTTCERANTLSFRVGDLLALPSARYDAILCRGVLNDVVDDDSRHRVFVSFAQALRPRGVLMLDVRDWEATKERKQREPLFRKSVETDRGRLTFTSYTKVNTERHELLLSETHVLFDDDGAHASDYEFVMRCWTQAELESALGLAGFADIAHHGAYDASVKIGDTDRLVVVCQLQSGVGPRASVG